MTPPVSLLKQKETALKKRVPALLADNDLPGLEAADKELRILKSLRDALSPTHAALWLPLSVLALAICVVALASAFRVGAAKVHVDARATAVEFRLSAESRDEYLGQPFSVTDFQSSVEIANQGSIRWISGIMFAPGSRISVSSDRQRCVDIRVLPQSTGGMKVEAAAQKDTGLFGTGRVLDFEPGDFAHFCLVAKEAGLFTVNPSAVDLSESYGGTPEVRSGTIVSGILGFVQTGQRVDLSPLDRVRLTNLASGAMALTAGNDLHVILSADAAQGERRAFDDGSSSLQDIRPTYLDIMLYSPLLKYFIGALTGSIGVIWAGLSYLGFRAR